MCDELLACRGVAAADDMLLALGRAPVAKALNEEDLEDLLSGAGFDRVAALLSADLQASLGDVEERAALRILKILGVDWAELTTEQRERVIARATEAVPKSSLLLRKTNPVFVGAVARIINRARHLTAAPLGAGVADVLFKDDAVLGYLATAHAAFVDQFQGAAAQHVEEVVRSVLAKQVEEGWRKADAAAEIARRLGPQAAVQRSVRYWDTVASAFLGRARTYGQLTALRDAGIEEYEFVAVRDEATTEVCWFLHGTVFKVQGSLQLYDNMRLSPGSEKDITPFVRSGRNDLGERVLYTLDSAGTRHELATVVKSAEGQRDSGGQYETAHTVDSLQAMGVCMPPLHPHCRSVVVARV